MVAVETDSGPQSFADWLRQAMARRPGVKAGLKIRQLELLSGADRSMLSEYLRGTSLPSPETTLKLARYFATDEGWLLSLVARQGASRSKSNQAGPIMVTVQPNPISGGGGSPTEAESIPYWPEPGTRNHDFIAFEVIGDCLEPRVMRGHRVVVDVTASPEPGDVVAVEHNGERLVKILERRGAQLWLVALQGPEPTEVTVDTAMIGVVVWAGYRP